MKRFASVQSRVAGLALATAVTLTGSSLGWTHGMAWLPESSDRAQMLEDFLFYVLTANPDLAHGNAQALFDSGISDIELADLVDSRSLGGRVEEMLRRGRGMMGVEDLVAQFESRLERGRQGLSRDSKRIQEAITMLTGNLRGRLQAQARLEAAGEYAIPSLLSAVVSGRSPELELAASEMIVRIKRQAVTPLCEALPWLDANNQRKVSDMLGEIGWNHAAPYLSELIVNPRTTQPVRESATRALNRVGVDVADPSAQFTLLSRRYFGEDLSLVAWPGEETNNVWSYDESVGLTAMPVPTAIFSEVMSMRSAKRALVAQGDNSEALALFIAANLKRENELPVGTSDPIFGESRFSPQFFATAAGTTSAQNVLALALDVKNTPLIRDAIAALAQTTGGANLFPPGSRRPLQECLRFPDRRVQIETALTLGRSMPTETFVGSDAVVPMLASAVRIGAESFAVVIADDAENRRLETGRLRELGFTVVSTASSASEAVIGTTDVSAVDLVVIRSNLDGARQAIAAMRAGIRTQVAPMLVITDASDKLTLQSEIGPDPSILVWQSAGDEAFTAAVESVMMAGAGGRVTESEADQYAFDALDTLQMIAVSNSSVYSILDAESALLDALANRSGGVRLTVADVLARIDTVRSQRALLDAAIVASGREQIELLDHSAASARRFGNRAEQRHIEALMALVEESSGALADAAARLHGALNLPTSNAVRLITTK